MKNPRNFLFLPLFIALTCLPLSITASSPISSLKKQSTLKKNPTRPRLSRQGSKISRTQDENIASLEKYNNEKHEASLRNAGVLSDNKFIRLFNQKNTRLDINATLKKKYDYMMDKLSRIPSSGAKKSQIYADNDNSLKARQEIIDLINKSAGYSNIYQLTQGNYEQVIYHVLYNAHNDDNRKTKLSTLLKIIKGIHQEKAKAEKNKQEKLLSKPAPRISLEGIVNAAKNELNSIGKKVALDFQSDNMIKNVYDVVSYALRDTTKNKTRWDTEMREFANINIALLIDARVYNDYTALVYNKSYKELESFLDKKSLDDYKKIAEAAFAGGRYYALAYLLRHRFVTYDKLNEYNLTQLLLPALIKNLDALDQWMHVTQTAGSIPITSEKLAKKAITVFNKGDNPQKVPLSSILGQLLSQQSKLSKGGLKYLFTKKKWTAAGNWIKFMNPADVQSALQDFISKSKWDILHSVLENFPKLKKINFTGDELTTILSSLKKENKKINWNQIKAFYENKGLPLEIDTLCALIAKPEINFGLIEEFIKNVIVGQKLDNESKGKVEAAFNALKKSPKLETLLIENGLLERNVRNNQVPQKEASSDPTPKVTGDTLDQLNQVAGKEPSYLQRGLFIFFVLGILSIGGYLFYSKSMGGKLQAKVKKLFKRSKNARKNGKEDVAA